MLTVNPTGTVVENGIKRAGYARYALDFAGRSEVPAAGGAVALGWSGVTVEIVSLSIEMDGEWLHARIHPRGKLTRVVTHVERDSFNAMWAGAESHPM